MKNISVCSVMTLYVLWALLLSVSGWMIPNFAEAHGTEARILRDAGTFTAAFHYSDGEPMSYAQVLIFSPSDKEIEYQNGRTDRRGRFAFSPDAPGVWHIEANDGMGHKAQISTDVPEKQPEPAAVREPPVIQHQPPKWMGVIAGLSLIMNLVFVVYFVKKGKKTSVESKQERSSSKQ